MDDITLAAQVTVPLLITAIDRGDRDRCARFVHAASPVGRGPFVTYSRPDRGTTGPTATGDGTDMLRRRFDEARGGTLFIDDVAALTADAQALLLGLLEAAAAAGSPAHVERPTVRIIAGARPHFRAHIATGAFRDTLFYRLNVIHIDLTGPV